jgi:phosphopantothenoylcysteine decarboxylase
MANVLLGVTGSVAAIKTPLLYALLKQAGHRVIVVATNPSLYFFDPAVLDPVDSTRPRRNPEVVVLEQDEWPGREEGQHYQRGDEVRHIELRRWADVFLLAPLDANTLAKLANGLADNCLTCVWRAWDTARPALLAPAMNTLMWQHPATARHFRQLAADAGVTNLPEGRDPLPVIDAINSQRGPLRVVAPEARQLACGDIGIGALAAPESIVAAVNEQMRSWTSNP